MDSIVHDYIDQLCQSGASGLIGEERAEEFEKAQKIWDRMTEHQRQQFHQWEKDNDTV